MLSKITPLFGLSRYLDRTFTQRIASAKDKSKSEVVQCIPLQMLAAESSHCSVTTNARSCWILIHTYLDVKAFGVMRSSCGDEWLAGDASDACCAAAADAADDDDARLWVAVALLDWILRSDSRSFMPTDTYTSCCLLDTEYSDQLSNCYFWFNCNNWYIKKRLKSSLSCFPAVTRDLSTLAILHYCERLNVCINHIINKIAALRHTGR